MELILKQGKVEETTFNSEEIKKNLTADLEKYKNLTYTDDQIKEAKSDRAGLNKFKTAIEDKRKEVKKAYLEPYNKFEAEVKSIVALIDEPINQIGLQIKAFDENKKENKRKEIEAFYKENAGEIFDLIELNKFFDPKWLNATTSMKSIEEAITSKITKTKEDLETIQNLNSDFIIEVKDKYLDSLDIGAAIKHNYHLIDAKNKAEEAKKATMAKNANVTKEQETVSKTETNPTPKPIPEPTLEKISEVAFRVWATPNQLKELRKFFIDNNIKFGRA
jgi:hypothetical protein